VHKKRSIIKSESVEMVNISSERRSTHTKAQTAYTKAGKQAMQKAKKRKRERTDATNKKINIPICT
jgi:hypothetical protein